MAPSASNAVLVNSNGRDVAVDRAASVGGIVVAIGEGVAVGAQLHTTVATMIVMMRSGNTLFIFYASELCVKFVRLYHSKMEEIASDYRPRDDMEKTLVT
jgi:hypothetical protein